MYLEVGRVLDLENSFKYKINGFNTVRHYNPMNADPIKTLEADTQ